MIILPTKGRPLNLSRFVRAYNDTKATLPVYVIFDEADAHNYNAIETPPHWRRISVASGTPLGGIFKKIYEKYPNEPYYGMVADDVVPETSGWDVIMADVCQPDKIVWGWDGIQNENLPVHPFIGGELVRKLGWWAAPGIKHWFVDNVWMQIAAALQCGVYLPQVKMPHLHPVVGKSAIDRTYRSQPSHSQDKKSYLKFMNQDFPAVIERVKSLGVGKT